MNCPTTNNGFRQESQESGIGVPSYRRIGVTNPSHKRYNHKESGLQTPPTRDITIKNRGYKPLLQEIHPFPFIRDTPIKESGLQTPPTKDITPPTRDIPIQVSVTHLTARCQRVEDFKRKCVSPHSHFLNQVVLLGSDMRIHRAFECA